MNNVTRHKSDCKMAFGRKDATCPRCIELINGAETRRGWGDRQMISNGKLAWRTKAQQEANRSREIKEHDCSKAHCHPTVCTAFDW